MRRNSVDRLYEFVTGDEDARVCRDIPEAACHHQPRNFFAYLLANVLNKIADEIASAKLVLPWMLAALGAPLALTGWLVPIREAGVLLPQLAVAAAVRHLPRRKGVWLLGAALSAVALVGMALASLGLRGTAAGITIIALLGVFSLARGLCSVAAKDVLGKTVSKTRRGVLMGWSASLGGLGVLAVGLMLGFVPMEASGPAVFAWLFGLAALLWMLSLLCFGLIKEEAGATGGGGNALTVAMESLALLRTDAGFRRFVLARLMLLAVGLAAPFYILLVQSETGSGIGGLGWVIIASGIGASLSSPFWGRLGDRSSRQVMAMAAAGHGILALLVCVLVWVQAGIVDQVLFWALVVVLLTVLHSGVRLGRKVYLVDMATSQTRAAYVAVSNTVIGVAMLCAGFSGLLAAALGPAAVLLLFGVLSLIAARYCARLPEVSG